MLSKLWTALRKIPWRAAAFSTTLRCIEIAHAQMRRALGSRQSRSQSTRYTCPAVERPTRTSGIKQIRHDRILGLLVLQRNVHMRSRTGSPRILSLQILPNLVPRVHGLLRQRLVIARWNSGGIKFIIPEIWSLPLPFLLHGQPIKKFDIFSIPPESNLATTTADSTEETVDSGSAAGQG